MTSFEQHLNGNTPGRWQRIDLTDPTYAIPAEPPSIAGLLYRGKRHVLSGPPESTKTLIALAIALDHIRAGGTVCHIDFEMGATATRRLLDDLAATPNEIASILHYEPDAPPLPQDIHSIIQAGTTLAIIDAAAGAYDVSALDDNSRQDAEIFARAWIRPLFDAEIATVLIDHVVKNSENRGKYSIGSERKLGAADVHIGLDAKVPLHRGAHGVVVMTTHKDRPGHLARPHPAEIELRSDPETHRITWTIKPLNVTDNERFKPSALMEKVSRYLEEAGEPRGRMQIENAVSGKAQYVRQAMDELVSGGYAAEEIGPRLARKLTLHKPYRTDQNPLNCPTVPTSSPTVPDGVNSFTVPTVPTVPPYKGGGRVRDSEATANRTPKNRSLSHPSTDDPRTAFLNELEPDPTDEFAR